MMHASLLRIAVICIPGYVIGTELTKTENPVPDHYIVKLDKEHRRLSSSSLGDFIQEIVQGSDIGAPHGTVDQVYESVFAGFAAHLDEIGLQNVLNNPNVVSVEEDGYVQLNQVGSWGLDRIDDEDLPLDNSYEPTFGNNGEGVTAYIIDTGVLHTHTEFENRATQEYNSVGDDKNYDCNGHGTHVAGTVGAKNYGVANKAKLVGVKVLSCSGSGRYSGVIAGINWVKDNAKKPATANMSLGGGKSIAINEAVKALVASGVSTVVAAGNNNADACGFSPASEPDAITVGATTNSDTRSSFSNYGKCVDIFAPGSSIKAPWIGSNTALKRISGTSMASPHVCGGAALYLGQNPKLTPTEILNKMLEDSIADTITSVGTGSPNKFLYVAATQSPTISPAPSKFSSSNPTSLPSRLPSASPSISPTLSPAPSKFSSSVPTSPSSKPSVEKYNAVGTGKKCPYDNAGRLFRTPDYRPLSRMECYEKCYNTAGCHYFSLGEGIYLPDKWVGVCMGCIAEAVLEDHDGFNAYEILKSSSPAPSKFSSSVPSLSRASPTASPARSPSAIPSESPSASPSSKPSVKKYNAVGTGKKCPYDNAGRLFRTPDYRPLSRMECYEKCYNTAGCHYFSLGEGINLPDKWVGVCMGCIAEAVLEDHDGFNAYEILKSPVPSKIPSSLPSNAPSDSPSTFPTQVPSAFPSNGPTSLPSSSPTAIPTASSIPTVSHFLSEIPSTRPSNFPSSTTTENPSSLPSVTPSDHSSKTASTLPSNAPSDSPSTFPSQVPSAFPSDVPTSSPSPYTAIPSVSTKSPSTSPSKRPSVSSQSPISTNSPTSLTLSPTSSTTSLSPTSSTTSISPTSSTTSLSPTSTTTSLSPTSSKSNIPTVLHFISEIPSTRPSNFPSSAPTENPSSLPSVTPSDHPSKTPSYLRSTFPSEMPSVFPSKIPTSLPSSLPSYIPSSSLSSSPSLLPSDLPSVIPSISPSNSPSALPTSSPSLLPSVKPSTFPSDTPTISHSPSTAPSASPSNTPSLLPSMKPSTFPSDTPTISHAPSTAPSTSPSNTPSSSPSLLPTTTPSVYPSSNPTPYSSRFPSASPSISPTLSPAPSKFSSSVPSLSPSVSFAPTKPISSVAKVDFSDPDASDNTRFFLRNGAQILPAPQGVSKALRISKDGPYALIPDVNINPSNMKECTLTAAIFLESVANNRGWLFGNENGGYDRTILVHDNRFGGNLASAVGKAWTPWNKRDPPPLKKWIHVTAVFRQGSESYVFMNGVHSDKTVIASNNEGLNNEGLKELWVGRPKWGGYWVDSWIKEVNVYDKALSDEYIKEESDKFHRSLISPAPSKFSSSVPSPSPSVSITEAPTPAISCDGKNNVQCKGLKEFCVFGRNKITGKCEPKKSKYKKDCGQFDAKYTCLHKSKGNCMWDGKCAHRCDGLAKKDCKKVKNPEDNNRKMCKAEMLSNPCKGCQSKTTCG